ncbi:major facilitator superfamily domain-containing protein [Flagelloscypha sp. PMI_526]|nr:major facilitator superfamily domain-containing protein [Flagelloscypha sp. PMI_526]
MSSTPEREPLLPESQRETRPCRKSFYRPRQLWIVPVILVASLVRGMTLAPRINVYTELACREVQWDNNTGTAPSHSNDTTVVDPHSPIISFGTVPGVAEHPYSISLPQILSADSQSLGTSTTSSRCTDDPAVQSRAATIQAIFTTTMGLLSAVTTAWWGHFSERHGRLRVMAMSTLGMFISDLAFTFIAAPTLPFLTFNAPAHHAARTLLVLAPAVEGFLGGWTTLQSALTAYISDCTSSGSRAHTFSRIIGCMYIGVSAGPALGGWLATRYRGPNPFGEEGHFALVFLVAAICSFINLLAIIFIFPESLSREKQTEAMDAYCKPPAQSSSGGFRGHPVTRFFISLISPLGVFLPVDLPAQNGIGKRQDWNLTLLAGASFMYMLSTGVYQLKYLYAEHIYGWDTEKLSYFITLLAGARAFYSIVGFPFIIKIFKPKKNVLPVPSPNEAVPDSLPSSPHTASSVPTQLRHDGPLAQARHLAKEINFDLLLAKCGIIIDILSNILVSVMPLPHSYRSKVSVGSINWAQHSSGMFIFSTFIASFGSSTLPVIQSLALCITKAREMLGHSIAGEETGKEEVTTGQLFGAFSVLQAVGQAIVGPALFALIYAETVATYPKGIFAVCAAVLFVSFIFILAIEPPAGLGKKKRVRVEDRRGRSRDVRDLRGGAIEFGEEGTSRSGSAGYGSIGRST